MAFATRLLACAAFTVAGGAYAQQPQGTGTVWRCTEQDGKSHYTNIKKETEGKQCAVVTREVSVVSAPPPQRRAAATPTPSDFPRVDANTQRSRDDGRRRILEDELYTEEKGLSDAKAKLAEQESIRNGDEKNYQRVIERLKPYQDAVDRAERNVAALKRELSGLR
ncbi:MAG TPA: DUF4124 domain-containing protein [Burkholderiales bacterium]|nr:DUF4124 domain-containing protein [Burkholderiales bacterium]